MKMYCILLVGLTALLAIGQSSRKLSDTKVLSSEDAERQRPVENWFELRTVLIDDNEKSFAIDGWMDIKLGSNGAGAFSLWETKEAIEFHRNAYGICFYDLKLATFLKKHVGEDNILWQKIDGRLVRLTGKIKKENPASGFSQVITEVDSLTIVGIDGEPEETFSN